MAQRVCLVPGASDFFRGGVVTYTDDVKARELGVPPALLAEHGAVSEPVARAMAEGVRAKFGTDLGVSTTGFAGPGGGTDANPVGTAYVGLAHAGGCEVVRWGWLGTRYEIMSRTAKLAPNAVRLELVRVRGGEGGRPRRASAAVPLNRADSRFSARPVDSDRAGGNNVRTRMPVGEWPRERSCASWLLPC